MRNCCNSYNLPNISSLTFVKCHASDNCLDCAAMQEEIDLSFYTSIYDFSKIRVAGKWIKDLNIRKTKKSFLWIKNGDYFLNEN